MAGGFAGGMAQGLESAFRLDQFNQRTDLMRDEQQLKKQRQLMDRVTKAHDSTKNALDELVKNAPNLRFGSEQSGGKFTQEQALQTVSQLHTQLSRQADVLGTEVEPLESVMARFSSSWTNPANEAETRQLENEQFDRNRQAEQQSSLELAKGKRDQNLVGTLNVGKAKLKDGRVVDATLNTSTGVLDVIGDPKEYTLDDIAGFEESSVTLGESGFGSKKDFDKVKETAVATFGTIRTGNEIITSLNKEPNANTAVASLAKTVTGLKQEAMAFADFIGESIGSPLIAFDENTNEESSVEEAYAKANKFADSLNSLAKASGKVKSLVVSMAFQSAAASESGGRFSDQDIERKIAEIGGNLSNPEAFASNVNDVQNRTLQKYMDSGLIYLGRSGFQQFQANIGPPPSILSFSGGALTAEEQKELEALRKKRGQ